MVKKLTPPKKSELSTNYVKFGPDETIKKHGINRTYFYNQLKKHNLDYKKSLTNYLNTIIRHYPGIRKKIFKFEELTPTERQIFKKIIFKNIKHKKGMSEDKFIDFTLSTLRNYKFNKLSNNEKIEEIINLIKKGKTNLEIRTMLGIEQYKYHELLRTNKIPDGLGKKINKMKETKLFLEQLRKVNGEITKYNKQFKQLKYTSTKARLVYNGITPIPKKRIVRLEELERKIKEFETEIGFLENVYLPIIRTQAEILIIDRKEKSINKIAQDIEVYNKGVTWDVAKKITKYYLEHIDELTSKQKND